MDLLKLYQEQVAAFDEKFGGALTFRYEKDEQTPMKDMQLFLKSSFLVWLEGETKMLQDIQFKWNGDGQSFTKGVLDDIRDQIIRLQEVKKQISELE